MGKLLTVLLAVVVAVFWNLYTKMDFGKTVYNHGPGKCRQVHGPVSGSEDIEIVKKEGIAFITSGLLYLQPHRADIQGKMFMYDFNQKLGSEQLIAQELKIKGDSFDQNNFHPHGLSHWKIGGIIRLYVVNHSDKFEHSVEVFDFDPSGPALIHKNSIKHPSFVRPNDLVAVGPDQFIFTNDGVTQTEFMNTFESLSGYNGGTVHFFDGKDAHLLLSGQGGSNGIMYDDKNGKLFVAEFLREHISAYDLSKDKKTATLLSSIPIHSGCDNLFLHGDGTLFTGCHPLLHETASSVADCESQGTSASQVLHIKFDKSYKTAVVTEPYANDGREVSGSSIAVVFSNQMLIGTVCKGLLHCEIADMAVL